MRIHVPYQHLIECVFACLLVAAIAHAQVYTSLSGMVTDATGAIVPRAEVTVKDQATGQAMVTYTDAEGRYRFPNLPQGTYDITVKATGFSEATQRVVTRVGEASSADFRLPLGSRTSPVITVQIGSGTIVTSRELLSEDAREEEGFGLYSYILFGSPPNDATRDRYLAALRSFLDMPPTREMVKNVPRKQLNVTYVPVNGHAEHSSPEELLHAYDYARASGLLVRISCTQGEAPCGPYLTGPYIISTMKPFTEQGSLSHHFLYQDLSSVPARIVPLWVDEFMKQSAQPDFWQKRNGPQVALELRTAIAVLGDGIPDVEHSADYWKTALATILSWH